MEGFRQILADLKYQFSIQENEIVRLERAYDALHLELERAYSKIERLERKK